MGTQSLLLPTNNRFQHLLESSASCQSSEIKVHHYYCICLGERLLVKAFLSQCSNWWRGHGLNRSFFLCSTCMCKSHSSWPDSVSLRVLAHRVILPVIHQHAVCEATREIQSVWPKHTKTRIRTQDGWHTDDDECLYECVRVRDGVLALHLYRFVWARLCMNAMCAWMWWVCVCAPYGTTICPVPVCNPRPAWQRTQVFLLSPPHPTLKAAQSQSSVTMR